MEALKVDRLSKNFGGVQAVHNVSFSVEVGERLAIIGPNGAGKTTLFNILNGQLSATYGKVYFFGEDITGLPVHHRAHLGMSRSFQLLTLFPSLTVLTNTLLALQGTRQYRFNMIRPIINNKDLLSDARELITAIKLWEHKNEPVQTLSYGEQRMLEIALSLAMKPKVLLLDEPSSGLTATESAGIIKLVRGLGSDITLIIVAHDMDLVFSIAQRILVLHYGEILAEGTCDEISCDARVKEIYMGG